MSQLVGQSCAACRRRIGHELNARFCGGCGRPVHVRCADKRRAKATPADCPECGLPRAGAGPVPEPAAVTPRRRGRGFVVLALSCLGFLYGLLMLTSARLEGNTAGDVAVGVGVAAVGLAGAAWGAIAAFRK